MLFQTWKAWLFCSEWNRTHEPHRKFSRESIWSPGSRLFLPSSTLSCLLYCLHRSISFLVCNRVLIYRKSNWIAFLRYGDQHINGTWPDALAEFSGARELDPFFFGARPTASCCVLYSRLLSLSLSPSPSLFYFTTASSPLLTTHVFYSLGFLFLPSSVSLWLPGWVRESGGRLRWRTVWRRRLWQWPWCWRRWLRGRWRRPRRGRTSRTWTCCCPLAWRTPSSTASRAAVDASLGIISLFDLILPSILRNHLDPQPCNWFFFSLICSNLRRPVCCVFWKLVEFSVVFLGASVCYVADYEIC